jgi:hypothetical protein
MTGQRNQFTSIEKDIKPLHMRVQHSGMTKQEALQLIDDIDALGLGVDVIEEPLPEPTRYERASRVRPALAWQRYNNLDNARYYVSVTYNGITRLLENRFQWGLFMMLHMPDTRVVRDLQDAEADTDASLEQALFELTGLTVAELTKAVTRRPHDEPEYKPVIEEVTDSEDIPISLTDVDLFETLAENNGYEDAWEAA